MIIANFNIDEIFEPVYAGVEDIIDAVILSLKMACLEVVAKARAQPSLSGEHRDKPHQPFYIDDTVVLRTSIGFAIYDHGVLVSEDFNHQGNPEGAKKGKEVAERVAGEYPNDIVAIIVAGADYAAAVESKGYNVISQQASEVGDILKQYLESALQSF